MCFNNLVICSLQPVEEKGELYSQKRGLVTEKRVENDHTNISIINWVTGPWVSFIIFSTRMIFIENEKEDLINFNSCHILSNKKCFSI